MDGGCGGGQRRRESRRTALVHGVVLAGCAGGGQKRWEVGVDC
jgi:hypothetical protein